LADVAYLHDLHFSTVKFKAAENACKWENTASKVAEGFGSGFTVD
jgi:hypothetical protein